MKHPVEKIMDDLAGLSNSEIKVVLLKLMIDEKISFRSLSESYVQFLEIGNKEKRKMLSKAALWLSTLWNGRGKPFNQAGIGYWLIKSGYIESAPIEETIKKYLEENPYSEDENGFPITKLK